MTPEFNSDLRDETGFICRPRPVMDAFEALRAAMDGKRITKLEWHDRDTYGLLKDGLLSLHRGGEPEDMYHAWIVSDGDLLGMDWVILP